MFYARVREEIKINNNHKHSILRGSEQGLHPRTTTHSFAIQKRDIDHKRDPQISKLSLTDNKILRLKNFNL